jgi:hypothetical protein
MFESHFQKVYRQNPRLYILCLLEENDDETIRDVLKTAFEKFHFIDVGVLVNKMVYNWTRQQNETISMFCVYDPFDGDGLLFCKNLTEDNLDAVMREINLFSIRRTKDLKRYPVKVSCK